MTGSVRIDKTLIRKHLKMDPRRKVEEKIVTEKLAVFTFDDEITERSLREYFKRHWDKLTVGMKKSTILFMGGVHGEKTGELGRPEDIETLQNQVRIICVHFFLLFACNFIFPSLQKESLKLIIY